MIFIRSLIFNLIFYPYTMLWCIILVPTLIMPRIVLLKLIEFYLATVYWIEVVVIGLNFDIRGVEYVPEKGPYLVAAKHQSAYETMKMFRLFKDPSIILKKELMRIPLWGWHAWKLDFIAIDRKDRERAMNSIIEGARRMKEQQRPVIIFPQGTRVRVEASAKDKPYKGGIVKMYEATNIPIVPLAMNSGLFWPRNSFIKRPGTVVFEFLPPIEPGLPDKKVMKALEERIEETSIRLMHEAKDTHPHLKGIKIPPLPPSGEQA